MRLIATLSEPHDLRLNALDHLVGPHISTHYPGMDRTARVPPVSIYRGEDVIVDSHTGNVYNTAGILFPKTLNYRQKYETAPKLEQIDPHLAMDTCESRSPVLDCCVSSHGNFWHWHVQNLAALSIIRDSLSGEAVQVLTRPMNRFMHDSAALLGYRADDFIEPSTRYIRVRDLIFCSVIENPGIRISPLNFSAFNKIGKTALADPLLVGPVYVSRNGTGDRAMGNEDALEAALANRGFRIIDSRRQSYAEQVALARTATALVGLHGAGLTHMGFLNKEATLFEIFPSTYVRMNFAFAAKALGLSYFAYIEHLPGVKVGKSVHDFTWQINIEQVVETIDRTLTHGQSTKA